MVKLTKDSSFLDLLSFNKKVYGLTNNRRLELRDLKDNMIRFAMRALKGIRKNNQEKAIINLCLAFSWFLSIIASLRIDLTKATWHHFPGRCSYCGNSPCSCAADRVSGRKVRTSGLRKKPKTMADWQKMFEDIYPASQRTLEHAGIHLAEEIGEFAESIFAFRSLHKDWLQVELEAADIFSNIMAVANSLQIDFLEEYVKLFSNSCHLCHQSPCVCTIDDLCSV